MAKPAVNLTDLANVAHILGLVGLQVTLLVIFSMLKDITPAMHEENVDPDIKYEHIDDELVACEVDDDGKAKKPPEGSCTKIEAVVPQKSPAEIDFLLQLINVGIFSCVVRFLFQILPVVSEKPLARPLIGVLFSSSLVIAGISFGFGQNSQLKRWDEFVLHKSGKLGKGWNDPDTKTIKVKIVDSVLQLEGYSGLAPLLVLDNSINYEFDTSDASLIGYELRFWKEPATQLTDAGTTDNNKPLWASSPTNCKQDDTSSDVLKQFCETDETDARHPAEFRKLTSTEYKGSAWNLANKKSYMFKQDEEYTKATRTTIDPGLGDKKSATYLKEVTGGTNLYPYLIHPAGTFIGDNIVLLFRTPTTTPPPPPAGGGGSGGSGGGGDAT